MIEHRVILTVGGERRADRFLAEQVCAALHGVGDMTGGYAEGVSLHQKVLSPAWEVAGVEPPAAARFFGSSGLTWRDVRGGDIVLGVLDPAPVRRWLTVARRALGGSGAGWTIEGAAIEEVRTSRRDVRLGAARP